MNLSVELTLLHDKATTVLARGCGKIGGIANPSANLKSLPGSGTFEQWMGSAKALAIFAALFAVFLGAGLWGVGSQSDSPDRVIRSKKAMVAGFAGAVVIGAAYPVLRFALNTGSGIC